jgi:hypothetical protein
MSERLFSHDPEYGITTYFDYDDDADRIIWRDEFDASALLDRNKSDIVDANGRAWGDGKLVARIPLPIYYDWLQKGYVADSNKLRSLLNDPDNQFMRCWPGRL